VFTFNAPWGRKVGSTAEFRKAFVARLKEACDASKLVPPPHKGRQQYISQQLGVAPEAVSKWFKGVAMPRPDKIERLAELLQVEQTWLSFGVSPEMDRQERKAHARDVDGAVHLVIGKCMLSGGICGFPGPRDPRAAYVDFYATIRGSVYATHVCLGREVSRDRYELQVPKEYQEVNCVAVIPKTPGKYDQLDLRVDLIDEHRTKKGGGYFLTIDRSEASKYTTGSATWPRIRFFGDR
jgi:transcriptional regulator with XRE-family HTH domain